MPAATEKQRTKISSWGNSDGVRIPRSIMRRGGFASGDAIGIFLNERGNIEIERKETKQMHRRVRPAAGVTFESLVGSSMPSECKLDNLLKGTDAWPEDMVGAELESWSQ